MKKILKYLYILPITIIFIDQLAKFFVVKNIPAYDFIPLIRSVLSVTKIYNSGIILGLYFQNNNLITIISLALVCMLLVFIFLVSKGKIKANLSSPTLIAFYLIIGGAISNIIDRILHNSVVDYISLDFINFPIFNIADIAITTAAILLIWEILFGGKKIDNEEKIK